MNILSRHCFAAECLSSEESLIWHIIEGAKLADGLLTGGKRTFLLENHKLQAVMLFQLVVSKHMHTQTCACMTGFSVSLSNPLHDFGPAHDYKHLPEVIYYGIEPQTT